MIAYFTRIARAGIYLTFALGVASSASATLAQSSADHVQPSEQQRFERSFPMNSGGTLVVENRKGTIHITGSDTDQSKVIVYKRFDGNDKYRAQWLADTRVNFTNEPNRVAIRVEYAEINCTFCVSIDDGVELTIAVPRQINVELTGDKPDIEVASIDGDIRINSEKSNVSIHSTSGAVRIETSKGDVKLSDVKIRGGLRLTSEKADATIETTSLTGDVDLQTEKGSIVLRMPSSVGADLDYVGGRRANFHCDFPLTTNESGVELQDVRAKVNRDEARVSGKLNQGGARMRLRTTRGSISLEKSS